MYLEDIDWLFWVMTSLGLNRIIERKWIESDPHKLCKKYRLVYQDPFEEL